MTRLMPLLSVALLPLAGCPEDNPRRPDTGEVDVHDTVEPDASDTVEPDGDTYPPDGDTHVPDGEVIDGWPWPSDPVAVPPSDGWRATLRFPEDPFANQPAGSPLPTPTWVKLTVLVGDPTRVYFQDSLRYPLHFDFATAELPPFLGATPDAFDVATLDSGPSKRALLGAVLIAPRAAWGGPLVAREIGVTLTGRDPLPPIVVETVLALVRDHLTVTDEGAPPTVYYFPAFEQRDQARRDQARLAAAGYPVSGPERWAQADACHVRGWALGRLVHLPGAQSADLDAAFADGRLGPDDLLLLDEPPEHLPRVAALLTLAPGSPTSSAAALAETYGVPYVHLATSASREAALSFAGRRVALRAGGYGDLCEVSLVDLEGTPYLPEPIPPIPPADLASLRALKQPAPLALPARPSSTTLARNANELTSSDAAHFGAPSTRFASLAKAVPEATPSPALALSFVLWDRLIAPARGALDALPEAFPADAPARAALHAALATARTAIAPPADLLADVTNALQAAGFDDTTPLVLAPSSNLDTATTWLARLFPDQRVCLADDADGDAAGPSRCDPADPSERTLAAALAALGASAYTPHAYLERVSRAVAEDRFALGALVYPAPAATVTGLATFTTSGTSAFATLTTQRAPVPVTHRLAQPERVSGGVYSFGTFLDTLQHADTVPLGAHVMRWEADYQALVALLSRAAAGTTGGTNDGSALELAFARAATLQLTRLHQRPPVDAERDAPTYLLPEPPVTLCTFQGEHGAILGNWRLKARVTLTHRPTRLDEASRRDTLFTHVRVERPAGTVEGDPSIFEGFTHEPGSSDQWGNPSPTIDSWLADDDGTRWALQTSLPWLASDAEVPLQILSDAWLTLDATYKTPRPEPDQWPEGTTTFDSTRLTPCPEDVPLTPQHPVVHRTATLGELSFDIRFYWPPPPTGPTAGYTAPLAAWDRTILTGFTSAPIELRGYWSQTYRPGHHNFSESFVFEPALEPGVPGELLAELEAKDLRAILVELGYETPTIHLIGLDGTPRPLGVGP